jgi:DNA processing protein
MGRRELLRQPAFAIVGSRNATPQGCADAEAFAAALSAAGLAIVSGLALGIDSAAHRGGLMGAGSSIAVMGTGPDRVYPARNRELAHELAAKGLVLSEFAVGTPPQKQNFRAGTASSADSREACSSWSDAVVGLAHHRAHRRRPGTRGVRASGIDTLAVLERARIGSSAKARSSSKPRRIFWRSSASRALPQRPRTRRAPNPRAAMRAILRALGHDPTAPDTIASRTRLSLPDVLAALTELEIDGRVASLPGGVWQVIH